MEGEVTSRQDCAFHMIILRQGIRKSALPRVSWTGTDRDVNRARSVATATAALSGAARGDRAERMRPRSGRARVRCHCAVRSVARLTEATRAVGVAARVAKAQVRVT